MKNWKERLDALKKNRDAITSKSHQVYNSPEVQKIDAEIKALLKMQVQEHVMGLIALQQEYSCHVNEDPLLQHFVVGTCDKMGRLVRIDS